MVCLYYFFLVVERILLGESNKKNTSTFYDNCLFKVLKEILLPSSPSLGYASFLLASVFQGGCYIEEHVSVVLAACALFQEK